MNISTDIVGYQRHPMGYVQFELQTQWLPDFDSFQRSPHSQAIQLESVSVAKRYSEFRKLYSSLTRESGLSFEFPPKKLVGNLDPHFLAKRKMDLQKFVDSVQRHPILGQAPTYKRFLGVLQDDWRLLLRPALESVILSLRDHPTLQCGANLPPLGWRQDKHFFQVNNDNQSDRLREMLSQVLDRRGESSNMILSWTRIRSKAIFNGKMSGVISRAVMEVKHPNLQSLLWYDLRVTGAVAIAKHYPRGSIRDLICGRMHPLRSFVSKYSCSKSNKLDPKQIRIVGAQILRALQFLHGQGLAHGSVSNGNVFIETTDFDIKLGGWENFFLGQQGIHEYPAQRHRNPSKSLKNLDIFGLAISLYEMTHGLVLASIDSVETTHQDQGLESLFQATLSNEALSSAKYEYPSLESLSLQPLFQDHQASPKTPIQCLQLPSHAKAVVAAVGHERQTQLDNNNKLFRAYTKSKLWTSE